MCLFIYLDLNLKILRDDSACPGACQVIKWVKGCFDALDKKYVSMKKVPLERRVSRQNLGRYVSPHPFKNRVSRTDFLA